ncbi:MAG: hypothetical protein Q9218_000952 [Villophora microphyllina]
MPNAATGHLVFYPSYCFKYSKTYNTWARLTASNVHTLEARNGYEGQNLYFHLNHPIRWVRLAGVIVAFDDYSNRIVMTLDDSSGSTIELFCRKETPNNAVVDTAVDAYGNIKLNGELNLPVDNEHTCTTNEGYKVNIKGIDIGSVVKVKGGISEFRGEKQITLERISVIRTTNEEAVAWTENATFYKDILSKHWIVSEQSQQEAKAEAMGLKREKEANKERRRKKEEREEKRHKKARKDDERWREKSHKSPEKKRRSSGAEKVLRKKEGTKTAKQQNETGNQRPVVRP